MIHGTSRHARVAGVLVVLLLAWAGTAVGAGSPEKADLPVVNLNTASIAELESLPGVGSVRARAIIAERKRRGGFESVGQLAAVKGVGPKLLERLRPQVTVEGEKLAKRP